MSDATQKSSITTMSMSRRSFLVAGGLGLTAFLAGCGSSQSSSAGGSSSGSSTGGSSSGSSDDYTLVTPGKLTMVSNLYFPPFVSMDDKTGDPVGFDVDITKEVAKRLGLEANILPTQQFDTLIPTIKAGGTADITIGAITITDERKKEVDFSDPYLDSNQALVVPSAATAKTADALNVANTKIAVQSGTTGEAWAQENLPNATIVPLDDIIQSLTGVSTGLYQASVCDLPVAEYLIKNSYSDLEVPDGNQIPTGEQYGIAVSKDNPGLTKAINSALASMKDDGTMDNLQTQWFGTVVSSS